MIFLRLMFLRLTSLRLTSLFTVAMLAAGLGSASHATAKFEDTIAQRTLACTTCHGKEGRAGPDGYYPRIAGKPAGYLYNQLINRRDGRRHYALMAGLLDPLLARAAATGDEWQASP